MARINRNFFAAMAVLVFPVAANAVPILTTVDLIAETDRTNFVDFEHLASSSTLPDSTSQDGVDVTQVGGRVNNIWSTCFSCWASNSTQSWYPSGGDFGFTQITRSDGSDFVNFGVDLGSGFGSQSVTLVYTLLLNDLTVLSGSFTYLPDAYVGFSGGGFDTVQLSSFLDSGAINALAIDNVELSGDSVTVPEPGILGLLGIGLFGMGLARRRKKV